MLRRPLRVVRALVLAALILTAMPVSAGAAPPSVASPAPASVHSLGQLSADWWQWAAREWTEGADAGCLYGRTRGNTALLAGSTGGHVDRSCIVAPGTSLLIPVINASWSDAEDVRDEGCPLPLDLAPDASLEERLGACASAFMDYVTVATAKVNGAEVEVSRARSSLFPMTAAEGNVFGIPAGNTVAVADGFWLRLSPLPIGTHEIEVEGLVEIPEFEFEFPVSVSYTITVAPPGRS